MQVIASCRWSHTGVHDHLCKYSNERGHSFASHSLCCTHCCLTAGAPLTDSHHGANGLHSREVAWSASLSLRCVWVLEFTLLEVPACLFAHVHLVALFPAYGYAHTHITHLQHLCCAQAVRCSGPTVCPPPDAAVLPPAGERGAGETMDETQYRRNRHARQESGSAQSF